MSLKKQISFLFVIIVLFFSVRGIWAQSEGESIVPASPVPKPTVLPSPTPTPIIVPNSAINLSVSPPSVFLETKPGETVETTVKVFNNAAESEVLTASLMTFSAGANGASPELREFTPADEYQDWLLITPAEFTVDPQKWQTLNVRFTPPETAGLTYYYALVITRKGIVNPESGESTVIGAPAILVLTKVKTPYEKQELQMLSFGTTQKVYEYLPAEFTVEVKNTGNIHLSPVGNIFIDDAKKKDVGLIELNRTLGVILPNSTRTYNLSWNDGFPRYENETLDGVEVKDKKGNPKKKLNWDFSQADKFRFGKYTAHLVFIYDDGERDVPTEATVSFWVIPWKILSGVSVVVLLALLGLLTPLFLLLRRNKKNKLEKKFEKNTTTNLRT